MEEQQPETTSATTPTEERLDYHKGRSITFGDLLLLFIKPAKFFSNNIALGKALYLVVVLFIVGFFLHFRWIDSRLMDGILGSENPTTDLIMTLSSNWVHTLGIALIFTPVSAVAMWYVGGWWYKTRLEWCGADKKFEGKDHDTFDFDARTIYTYSFFIMAFPAFIQTLTALPFYENYGMFFVSKPATTYILLLFPFLSIYASYKGITTVFEISEKRLALFLFVTAPVVIYAILIGRIIQGLLAYS